MAQVTLPYTLTAGTPENVNNLVANLNALVAGVNTIDTAQIASSAVTTAKIADANVTTLKVADGAITSAKIADGTIVNGDLASGKFTNVRGIQASDYCFRAIRTAVGSIAHNTNSVLVFDSEAYDYNANYNPANGHYTAPTAGVYHFDATVAWDTGSVVS